MFKGASALLWSLAVGSDVLSEGSMFVAHTLSAPVDFTSARQPVPAPGQDEERGRLLG